MSKTGVTEKMDNEGEVLKILSHKKIWTSDELQQLLDQQQKTRQVLIHKKENLEREADRLCVDRKKMVKIELEELHKTFNRLKIQVNKLIKEKLPGRLDRPDFYRNVQEADELEKASAYLTVLNFIKSTSEQIDANLETELETEAIELFHRLKKLELAYLDITDCSHLQEYGKGVVAFWESRLREKLVKDFEELLEAFGWPMRLKTATPTLEVHDKFHRAILNLSKISSNMSSTEASIAGTSLSSYSTIEGFSEPLLPVKIMMGPIKRRFRFHFFSDKPTSESSRPDWYFSQVKNWLHDLIPFVRTHLEPVSVSEIGISSIIEFTRAVSEMLVVKVDSQLDDDIGDGVFVKILEEAISYENEIREFVGEDVSNTETYMPPFVNTVFSRPHILERWLSVERKSCLEKLDEMFASLSAWNRPVVPGPPEIADLFLAVVRCVTDRFAHLQQPGQRMQFLKLLIDLLDDFRVRCLQMWKSKTEYDEYLSKDILIDYVIADTLYFVQNTLHVWEDLSFFASLSFFIESVNREEEKAMMEFSSYERNSITAGFESLSDSLALDENTTIGIPSKGLFSNVCNLYVCLGDEILTKWCQKVLQRIKDEIHSYAKQKWQSYDTADPVKSLSEKLMLPIQALKDIGKAVSSSMDSRLADKWLKKLAIRMDDMLMETVILPNRFSRPAIEKLCFDLNNGVFPAFSENGVNETLFLGCLCSAVKILEMSTGEAMLLYDTLMNGSFEAHELALAELGISICQSEVIKILRGRCDLHL